MRQFRINEFCDLLFGHIMYYAYKYLMRLKFIFRDISETGLIRNRVLLEASTICQLRCPSCSTGKGERKTGIIGTGYLKFEDFKRFIDKNPNIKSIELSHLGEIFLNPDLKEIIEYASRKKIYLTAYAGVNLNDVSREMLEFLVKSRFAGMTVSLDGATNETYRVYRIGGNFDRVIENIGILNDYKKKYNSRFPHLIWQFVIMGHNEHQLPLAKRMAKELSMSFETKLSWDPGFSPVRNKEFVRKESGLGVASWEEFKEKYGYDRRRVLCKQFWTPQINWDGKLLGCCVNEWVDFGNVFEQGLSGCLKSEKYVYGKKVLLGKEKARADIPCSRCPVYDDIPQNPLKKKEILDPGRALSASDYLWFIFSSLCKLNKRS